MIKIMKLFVYIFWFVAIANWILPFGGVSETILNYLSIGIVIAHGIEMVVFRKQILEKGDNPVSDFYHMFLLGGVWLIWLNVRDDRA